MVDATNLAFELKQTHDDENGHEGESLLVVRTEDPDGDENSDAAVWFDIPCGGAFEVSLDDDELDALILFLQLVQKRRGA